jgi:Zn-dependent metalloprotease
MCLRNPVHCEIIPPHILRHLAETGDSRTKDLAFRALNLSAHFRGQRQVLGQVAILGTTPTGDRQRTIYDAMHDVTLPGDRVRGENDGPTGDVAANEAFDFSGDTYDFFKDIFQRNSIDDRGLRLDSTVHYGDEYTNAFWNGQQMVYGDGDSQVFTRFTASLDVVGHELTHGITQHEAALDYQGESGALNEHFSDVFGSLVKQYHSKQSAAQADWLIGKELLMPGIPGVALALRSMKAPGTAYDSPLMGRDPQPDHMKNFVHTQDDHGGVHINSGIPNKAFYTFAVGLGGNAWEQAGKIWYVTLCNELSSNATFQDCADKTYKVARDLFGADVADKVRKAWRVVGLTAATTLRFRRQPATQTPQPKARAAGGRS